MARGFIGRTTHRIMAVTKGNIVPFLLGAFTGPIVFKGSAMLVRKANLYMKKKKFESDLKTQAGERELAAKKQAAITSGNYIDVTASSTKGL
jgi:hypothetical protein